MAWFRVRGNSITLVHGIRTPGSGVRQRRIRTFSGAEDLRRHLEPDAWARLQVQVEQEHLRLSLDWKALHRQAVELAGPAPGPRVDKERMGRLRRTLRRLVRELPADSHEVARALGPLLRDAAQVTCRLYLSHPLLAPSDMFESLFPGDEVVEDLLDRGRDAMHRRRGNASKLFDEARRCNPYDPDIDNSEGICWLEFGDLEKAELLFQRARGLAFCQLPDPDRAYSWAGLEVRPYLRATNNLGLVRERQGRLAEALELFEECLRRCPDDGVGARFHLGTLHQRLGHMRRALECHRAACRGSLIGTPDPHFDAACVLLQLNDPREAVKELLAGITINQHIPRLLLKPPKRLGEGEELCTVDSAEWARSYVRNQAGLWPPEALAFLEKVWRAPEVRERLSLLRDLEEERQCMEGEAGIVAAGRLSDFRRDVFPEGLVLELQERLAACWESPAGAAGGGPGAGDEAPSAGE